MSQLQYIGARYVPIWYVNSVDQSANWEVNVEYEPLTWVTTPNNHLYLSKKTVPDNIGTPASNTDYWLDMGIFSGGGSIQNLQDQIDQIVLDLGQTNSDLSDTQTELESAETRFSLWHNKKVVVYGDSLSVIADNYWSFLTTRDTTIQLTNRAVGGSTIAQTLTLLQNATDLATYDIIVIAHGTNEWQQQFPRDFCKSYFKQAFDVIKTAIASTSQERVFVITPFYSQTTFGNTGSECNSAGMTINDYNDAITEVALDYGYPVLNFFTSSSCNSGNVASRLDDSGTGVYVHENAAFAEELSYIVENWDGQTYTPRPFIFGKNILNTVEFMKNTRKLTQTEYVNGIPAKYRDGICVHIDAADGGMICLYPRNLSASQEYNVRFWADQQIAFRVIDSANNDVISVLTEARHEFTMRFTVPSDGYYKFAFNINLSNPITIIGGIIISRADGVAMENPWRTCELRQNINTGTASFQCDGDTITLRTTVLNGGTNGNMVLGLPGISSPGTSIAVPYGALTNPVVTIGQLSADAFTIYCPAGSNYYVSGAVLKPFCYNFDFSN